VLLRCLFPVPRQFFGQSLTRAQGDAGNALYPLANLLQPLLLQV